MKKIVLFFLIIFSQSALSQTFSVFDVDYTDFPTMHAKFYAFDDAFHQIIDFDPEDFQIFEDWAEREVLRVSCPEAKSPEAISAVLTIDVSGSMKGQSLEIAKEASKACVETLPLGNSECAITSFQSKNFFNQDFSTDRNKLLLAIDNLKADGGTNFNAGFIDPMAGAILVSEKSKYKKVIVFITDGGARGDEEAIINKAKSIDAVVYCVVLNMECPDILKNIATKTGGLWFEKINTIVDAERVFMDILHLGQNISPCEIEWTSEFLCNPGNINVNILNNVVGLNNHFFYKYPDRNLSELLITPSTIHFINKTPKIHHDTNIVIEAIGSDFNISDIISFNSDFTVEPSSFELKKGEKKVISVSYTPYDSGYAYSEFNIINNVCQQEFSVSGGFEGKGTSRKTLEITHPNGGEIFVVGSDTLISWKGISIQEQVEIEYSYDNGLSWQSIYDLASNYKYYWNNLPLPSSKKCLVKVKEHQETDTVMEPYCVWQQSFGGSNDDIASSIQQTEDGGYIIAGNTKSNDGDVEKNFGANDIWIIKLDYQGEIEWKHSYGGSSDDIASSIQQTEDGGYIVAGYTKSNDGDVEKNFGANDIWIIKLDYQGEIEWKHSYGGSKNDIARSIQLTEDGGYIVSGYTESNDGDLMENFGENDIWIIKLDNKGIIEWQKCFGGNNDDMAFAIQQTKEGGYIVAGESHSKDFLGDTNYHGSGDAWFAKLNMYGDIEWQKCLGDDYIDYFTSVQQTTDGGYILVGPTTIVDTMTIDHQLLVYWIVKLDQNGVLEWERKLGGGEVEIPYSIQLVNEDGYIIAGATYSDNGDIVSNHGIVDYWIIKLGLKGNIEWTKCFGGSKDDIAISIQYIYLMEVI